MQLPTEQLTAAAAWLADHPEIAALLVSILTGGASAARAYLRTGRIPLRTLPWRALRRLFGILRRAWFTVPRRQTDPFVPDRGLEVVRQRLAEESYMPGWQLSYHYQGEDLNARRYFYDARREHPHRQLHVRGFVQEDGTVELQAHEEPCPVHHPKAHLTPGYQSKATDWLETAWESPALDPRTFERSG